jgi:hypothetical protein
MRQIGARSPQHAGKTDVSRRRFLAGVAGVAAVPAAGVLQPAVATADPRWPGDGCRNVVTVVATEQRIHLSPKQVPAGVIDFAVSTPGTVSIAPGLFRLKGDTSIDVFLDNYAKANSTDPATKAAATALIDEQAVFLGGAAVTSVSPVRTTAVLSPGTYYVFNYNAALTPYAKDSILPLQVGPRIQGGRLPEIDATIVLHGSGVGSRYDMPGRIRAHGTLWVSNLTPQTNETMWLRVVDDATDEDMREFWAAVLAGKPPARALVTGQPEGLAPLSSGESGIVTTAMPRGKYMITTFMYNRETWRKGVFENFWKLVTLY